MNDLMTVVDWSRAQFALTAMYHWLFVPLTIKTIPGKPAPVPTSMRVLP